MAKPAWRAAVTGDPSKPLDGVRVLELARILAGPWCGQLLADLGAEVIKIERPGAGDDTRHWGPPFVTAEDGTSLGAAYFHSTNRGKRSFAIDIASAEGQAIIRELANGADIVIENYKVGGLAKYGLDHAALSELNPRLITCSITGFGQTGPYAHRAGYDFIAQAMGGMMSMTGEPDREPQKAGIAVADLFTGMYSTVAILAALNRRDRTGSGAHIDMALLDTQVAVMANQAMNWMTSGKVPRRFGNGHANLAPYQAFPTLDGPLVIAAGNDGQFASLCRVLRCSLHEDPRFATNPARLSNRAELVTTVEGRTAQWNRQALFDALEEVGVPAGPINELDEVFADPQVVARGLAAMAGGRKGVASPIVIDGVRMVSNLAAPGSPEPVEDE
ncbi:MULTISPECIES: CaiB/BaiF CoA transferase family protein [Novosphingobium]|jgi:crotonobetainyl-CoA:carnitine CoA-transferase CaiB-like acyl-CoA transferase|uniref:CoA transferase n=3 Tax=Novosphingobium TaxID=165696 RepID=A0A7Y0GAH8_9SPHN|nr:MULTISPECIES: CoA transferase [Novosphingobium]ABP64130.1 L-carnitine dehydratase/bile acid-inducible protein F [Novosphingobium aromaticivorans DSM 12444]KHS43787.1 L-carnitine dehydratase/bile acid-inducible protein F [Novosphingobium subterraneum]MCW1384338.1 CoA transferase [Novosphingobium sp. KCTC 2891]NML95075.1 CoA transferase [Novosphingobium olei]SCY83967.1 Crotonobetainyl-CoA:carnitine CoA-transferase CaiB [Novosphingobium aromaticivorans]